jgi:hypothetical protein
MTIYMCITLLPFMIDKLDKLLGMQHFFEPVKGLL